MNSKRAIVGLWVLVAMPALLLAQGIDEKSIPEPTRLGSVALSPGAEVRAIGVLVSLASRESNAQIGAVEVRTEDGKHLCGLRVILESPGHSDTVYLDINEAAQLRREFAGFDALYHQTSRCEATNMCVMGVARCRPSQTVRQAYCPSSYLTAEGERGVYLSSSRFAFRFPLMQASAFVSAIEAVMAECSQSDKDAQH